MSKETSYFNIDTGLIALFFTSVIFYVFFFWPLEIDDAYIYFRLAENAHQGFAWNKDGVPIEGMTSILWTVILSVIQGGRQEMAMA